jgi:hypothetical protein
MKDATSRINPKRLAGMKKAGVFDPDKPSRSLYYKTFYVRPLRIFVIS